MNEAAWLLFQSLKEAENTWREGGGELKAEQFGTISWKAEGVAWWIFSLGKSWEFSICFLGSWLTAPQRIFRRQTRGRIRDTQGQKPDLTEDAAEGLPDENPEGGLQSKQPSLIAWYTF